ncbi:MAG: hypothetical protein H6741_25435 [Alphaproteobacteria bacterium]|nr:hypothetical protein [Alphaproteobacteria bacterium]
MSAELLWIHPAPGGEARPEGAPYPVLSVGGVAHLNRLAAAGLSVAGLNVPVERVADAGFSLAAWMRDRPAPRLLLLDLHWYEHAAGVVEAAELARAAWPEVEVWVGGLTASRFAEELLALCPAVHGVLRGDVEAPLLALARGSQPREIPNLVFRDADDNVVSTPRSYRVSQAELDAMDSVDLSWLSHAPLYRQLLHSRPSNLVVQPNNPPWAQWIPTGRGCAFECAYCGGARSSHAALSGLPGVLKRDPVAVARDVARLQALGVQQLATTLDPDMLGRRWKSTFFEALSGRPGLYLESFQLPSRQLLDGVAERADLAHSELALTPLSGDLGVRRRNGKHYPDDKLLEALDAAWARGLAVFLFFSLNLPGEDARTLEATCALTERVLDRAPAGLLRVINICHSLDPASPLLRDPDEHGVSEITLRSLADYVAYGRRPRPFGWSQAERGFVLPGRDLEAMAARWDALAAAHPGRVFAVPRV